MSYEIRRILGAVRHVFYFEFRSDFSFSTETIFKGNWRFYYNSQNSHSTASQRFKRTRCERWYLPEAEVTQLVQVFCIRELLAFPLTVCQTLPEVMADQVAAMCDQLIKAVNVMMDPETDQIYRLEALKVASLWVAS